MNLLELSANKLLTFFYAEANFVAIIICAIIASKTFREINIETKNKFFIELIFLHILFFIVEIFWAASHFNIMPNPIEAMKWIRVIKVTIVGLGTYVWTLYIGLSINNVIVDSPVKRKLIFIPIIIQLIFDYVVIFNFDLDRVDTLGYIMSFLIIIVPLLYMVCTSIYTTRFYFKNQNEFIKKDSLVYLIYPVSLVIAAVLQVVLTDLPILCFATSIALLALFINKLGNVISLDPLTETYNRNALMRGLYASFKNEQGIYCFIMDLDHFKLINDKYGHIEGDNALKAFANALRKTCENDPRLLFCRYGGDEFIVFAKNYNDEKAYKFISLLQANVEEANTGDKDYRLEISIGFSRKQDYENINNVINRADKMLYDIKRKKNIKR